MWKTLSSKIIHKNKWYQIRHNKFETQDKIKGNYYILETRGSSMIIPVKGNKIILEKQYRYPINKWTIELPAGSVKKNFNYLKTAKAELEEELGYKAGSLKMIGKFLPYNGISSEVCKVFLAERLKYVGAKNEASELIKPIEVGIKRIYEMIDRGEIMDGMSIAALSLARKLLLGKKKI